MNSPDIDIGSRLMIYRGRSLKTIEIVVLTFLLILFAIIPFLIGFYRTLYGYAQYGPAASTSWGLPYFIFSMVASFLLIPYILIRLDLSRTSISLHKSGIIIKKPLIKDQILCWDEINAIYVSTEHRSLGKKINRMKATLCTKSNKEFTIKDSIIGNLPELITQIKSSVYINLSPTIRERFRSGAVIPFGPLDIQQKYLVVKQPIIFSNSKKLFWRDINRITVKSGYLLVQLRDKKTYRIRAADIPNIEILLSLVEDNTRR